jgi:hypothetical protein
MLSDSEIIDNVNPFVYYPPGAWSNPYPFSPYMTLPDKPFEVQDPSSACETQTTAGDRQIDWCKPRQPNCPIHRELEPTQRADPDISYEARGDVPYGELNIKNDGGPKFDKQFFMNLVGFIIMILLILRLTEKL